jgi:hypothetical protein
VRVIDAPTPGFNLDTVSGCAPLSIIISDTLRYGLTKKEYYFEDKNKWLDVNLDSLSLNYIFTKAGAFKVIQRLTGVTGCVVQHDSTIVTVHESIDNYGPVMSYGSYQTNEAIELRWTELFGAVNYSVYRSYNSSVPILITNTPLTRYVDTVSNPDYYKYFVQANDECGNISRQSAQLYPIFLQGIVAGENYYAQLEFTKYEIGIVEIEYEIAALVDLNWEIIAHTSDTTFRDYEFLNHGDSACKYRVSCLYDGQEAFSNILTLYQIPTVYIPTAFSPNNDGMNDNFKLVSTGISDYHVLVYIRWGQRVYEFSKGDNWDANNTNPGVYLVVVQATTFDQQRLYFSSTVTVLR